MNSRRIDVYQHGDGMFELRTLPLKIDGLGLGALELGGCLGYVGFGYDIGAVLVLGQV